MSWKDKLRRISHIDVKILRGIEGVKLVKAAAQVQARLRSQRSGSGARLAMRSLGAGSRDRLPSSDSGLLPASVVSSLCA